jgi:NTE family protein
MASDEDIAVQTGLRMGLVLPGGGARGAYQVGVLKAISDFVTNGRNPFPVVVGASVGAINAAVIGTRADNFKVAVRKLTELWSQLHTGDIYRTDLISITASGLRWLFSLARGVSLIQNRFLTMSRWRAF